MEAFGPPTISVAKFTEVLQGSPCLQERNASSYYHAIIFYGLDPAFMLAIFKHESDCARNPAAVVNRYGTKNWGNTRTNSGAVFGAVIQTDRGPFVRFFQWIDGLHDACNRLIAPHYPYAPAGARAVETIIPLWAPSSDSNNVAAYVASVLLNMVKWKDVTPVPSNAPKPPIDTNHPSPNRGGYAHGHDPRCVVWHITQGVNSLGWLTSPASKASSNYLIRRDGYIYQLVPPTVSAWANGAVCKPDRSEPVVDQALREGRNLNTVSISIEHEGFTSMGKGGSLTAAQVDATVALTAWLCETFGIPPTLDGIIGHYAIDACNRPNCPGFSSMEWNVWIARVAATVRGTPAPRPEGWINVGQPDTFLWPGAEGVIVERESVWFNPEKQKYYRLRWHHERGFSSEEIV